MNCIIIEDQPPAQRILKQYINDIGSLQLKATFADAIQAMAFLKSEPIDLIFLDIHLPKLSGIDFLKTLPHPPAVILTTAFPDYALESYELDVVDYSFETLFLSALCQSGGQGAFKKQSRTFHGCYRKSSGQPTRDIYQIRL